MISEHKRRRACEINLLFAVVLDEARDGTYYLLGSYYVYMVLVGALYLCSQCWTRPVDTLDETGRHAGRHAGLDMRTLNELRPAAACECGIHDRDQRNVCV